VHGKHLYTIGIQYHSSCLYIPSVYIWTVLNIIYCLLLQISGDHNESQLLLGLELYKERHDYMKLLLFELANFQQPVVEVDRGTQVPYVVYVP